MSELDALYAFLVALAVAALTTPPVARLAKRAGAVDELREALHDAPAHAHDHDGDLASHSVIAQETKRQYYAIALGVLTVLEPEEEFDFEDNAEEVERYPDYERGAIEEIHEARTGVDRTPPTGSPLTSLGLLWDASFSRREAGPP